MMSKRYSLTAERLRELCHYDPETGLMTLIAPRGRAKAGSVIGCKTQYGYWQAQIDGRLYMMHRLVWLYVYGEWSSKQIDHINRDRADNRLCNLRLATPTQNQGNRARNRNNTSGVKGVSWCRNCKRWHARISQRGVAKNLGYFVSKDDAASAYRIAAEKYFGDYARAD